MPTGIRIGAGQGGGPAPGSGAERTAAERHNRGHVPEGGGYPTLPSTYDAKGRQEYLDSVFKEVSQRLAKVPSSPAPAAPHQAAGPTSRETAAATAMQKRIAEMMAASRKHCCAQGSLTCTDLQQQIDRLYPEVGGTDAGCHELLDIADVLADAASLAFAENAYEDGNSSLAIAKTCIDLATDFIPGVSLAKDVACLASGENVITGEQLTAAEKGFLVASLLVPGVLKNGVKNIAKAGQALRKVIHGGTRSAPKAARLLESVKAAEESAARYGVHVDEAFASRAVQEVAQKWGRSSDGMNQLLAHTVGKLSEPQRLLRIEEYGGVTGAVVGRLIDNPSSEAARNTLLLFDRLAHEVVAYGERHISHVDPLKVWFHKPASTTPRRGLVAIVYDGKLQSLMPMRANNWEVIKRSS